ncbi:MAG: hypothetical protein HQL34_07840 [Alphaproteobacteria bacterium]|nr:hypothetical protein [Alphaproteobacteria bacterium]
MAHPGGRQGLGTRCAALVILASALLASGAEAAVCARESERPALNARVLQTQLMVAALSCGEKARYNGFVKKFGGELAARGRTLISMFDRAYGRGGKTEMNRFVTSLANDASSRSLASDQFCEETAVLFDTLERIEPSLLSELAENQPFAETHGVDSCRRQASAVGRK